MIADISDFELTGCRIESEMNTASAAESGVPLE